MRQGVVRAASWAVTMRALSRRLALAALLAANAAQAANIVIEKPETPTSPAVVSVAGRVDSGDYAAFILVTQHMKNATIYFYSEGGEIADAVLIGQLIREKRFNTAVADQETCWSACALAWLGGAKRFLGNSAAVGFHAPHDKTGQRSAHGEATVSAYLKEMGLPDRVAIYVLEPGPKELNFLMSETDARAHGIELTKLPIREFVPLP